MKAYHKLQIHYASVLIQESKYFEIKDHIASLRKVETERQDELNGLTSQFDNIQRQLSETVKGASKVNEYLQSYFGRNDIELKVSANDAFKLFRNDKLAKNLSEGEKTAIAFAYFITKLEEKGSDLSKTIVYVDDPISSLDSNHLFSTYSFIKNKLSDSHQLFISTHNFEFLNLIKDWRMRNKSLKNKTAFYLIERCVKDDNCFACLSDMPHQLVSFKSEYHYLFTILHEFYSAPKVDYNKLYTIPNLARRFLEAYLGFKIPKYAGLETKLKHFLSDDIKRDKINKFVQQYSHNNSLPRSLMFPDFGECQECIAIIMDRIQEYDADHYGYLVEEIQPSRK